MSEPLIKLSIRESTATLVLNRPDKCNALSREMLSQISQAFDDLHQEKRVRAVILTASGTVFSAGQDLKEMLADGAGPDVQLDRQADVEQNQALVEQMLRFPKVVIAAVNGAALGVGAALVLAADVVIASEKASFGVPEVKRGLVSGLAGPLLAFRVGAGAAGYLLTTGRTIDAQNALRLGVFHEVVPDEHMWVRAADLAREAAQAGPSAILMTKRLVNETIGEQLTTLMTVGAAACASARTTEDAEEGITAFLDRRLPKW